MRLVIPFCFNLFLSDCYFRHGLCVDTVIRWMDCVVGFGVSIVLVFLVQFALLFVFVSHFQHHTRQIQQMEFLNDLIFLKICLII